MKTIIKDGNYETGLGALGTDGEIYNVKLSEDGELLCQEGLEGISGISINGSIIDGNYQTGLTGIDSTDSSNLIPIQFGPSGELLLEI